MPILSSVPKEGGLHDYMIRAVMLTVNHGKCVCVYDENGLKVALGKHQRLLCMMTFRLMLFLK